MSRSRFSVGVAWSRLTRLMVALMPFTLGPSVVVVSAAQAGAGVAANAAEQTCASEAANEASAHEMALRCGARVEVVNARSPWETLWATPNGTFRYESSVKAVRTRATGSWSLIDTWIVPTADGLSVVAPVHRMLFSDGSPGRPLAQIERDGHTLEMSAPFALTTPVIVGAAVIYPAVLPDIDLVVSVNEDGTGFSEVLRVATPEAAATPALAELTFPIRTSGELTVQSGPGAFTAVDDAGNKVFTSPKPLMWDSSGDGSTAFGRAARDSDAASARAKAPLDGDVAVPMVTDVSPDAVTVTPDASMLSNARTAWPVYIDPGVTGTRYEWAMIQSCCGGDDPTNNWSGDMGVGFCDVSVDSACNYDNKKRVAWEYHDLGTIGGLDGSQITEATFSVYGTNSYECTDHSVQVYRLPGISSLTTWNNYASYWTSDRYVTARSFDHRTGSSSYCSGPGWTEFDVRPAARYVAEGNYSTLVLGLRAASETCMHCGWQRFRYDSKLAIEYNRYPNTPSSQYLTVSGSSTQYSCSTSGPGPTLRDATPTLNTTISDPDGGNVSADFLVETSGGTDKWNPAKDTAKSSGSPHSVTVPSSVGLTSGAYRWTVAAVDPLGLRKNGSTCYFTLDLVAPTAVPGVTARTDQPAVYLENTPSGGVGVTGKFYFTNGGVSDIVKYKYSFDSDALDAVVNAIAGSSTDQSGDVTFTPATSGAHTLHAVSVDGAGWISNERIYKIIVDWPGEDGWWKLNEGLGFTAADSTTGGNPLTLSSTMTWTTGPLADFGLDPNDMALEFNSTLDLASTADHVVATNKSFTVMAMVNLADPNGTYTAVSQDGEYSSGFKLGYRTGAGSCPVEAGTSGYCWAFWMLTADSETSGSVVMAGAPLPPTTGEWVHLTGVYDATAHQITVYACPLSSGAPIMGSNAHTSTWNAVGPLRVGRGLYRGNEVDFWPGSVDDVRVFQDIVPEATIRDICQGAQ